jgi:predicted aspartyl protease
MKATGSRSGHHRTTKQVRGAKKVGTFSKRIELAATAEGPFRSVSALVDTGSIYTWIPGRIIRGLGISATDQYEFIMANGEKIKRDRVEALIRLDGRVMHTICVIGEDGDQALLGAYTLEGFALAVDPLRRRLVPMEVLPAASTETEGGTP